MDNEYLTAREVAALLRLSQNVVYQWRKRGWLKGVEVSPPEAGRSVIRFRRADVENLLAGNHG